MKNNQFTFVDLSKDYQKAPSQNSQSSKVQKTSSQNSQSLQPSPSSINSFNNKSLGKIQGTIQDSIPSASGAENFSSYLPNSNVLNGNPTFQLPSLSSLLKNVPQPNWSQETFFNFAQEQNLDQDEIDIDRDDVPVFNEKFYTQPLGTLSKENSNKTNKIIYSQTNNSKSINNQPINLIEEEEPYTINSNDQSCICKICSHKPFQSFVPFKKHMKSHGIDVPDESNPNMKKKEKEIKQKTIEKQKSGKNMIKIIDKLDSSVSVEDRCYTVLHEIHQSGFLPNAEHLISKF